MKFNMSFPLSALHWSLTGSVEQEPCQESWGGWHGGSGRTLDAVRIFNGPASDSRRRALVGLKAKLKVIYRLDIGEPGKLQS
jgi:hypothetical protein